MQIKRSVTSGLQTSFDFWVVQFTWSISTQSTKVANPSLRIVVYRTFLNNLHIKKSLAVHN